MTMFAQESLRYSNLVKWESAPEVAYCRESVTVNESALTEYVVGTALGRVISGGTASAVAASGNTGTGTFGTITVTAPAKIGEYRLVITAVAANAGTFLVVDPDGIPVGTGTVAVAFSKGGLAFTLADATDFVLGDSFTIKVVGSYKYKVAVETATDGSAVVQVLVLEAKSIAATTDTKVLVLFRGDAVVSKSGIVLDATYNTDAEKAVVYAALEAKGILVSNTI